MRNDLRIQMRFAKHPKEQEVIEADNADMEELRNIENEAEYRER